MIERIDLLCSSCELNMMTELETDTQLVILDKVPSKLSSYSQSDIVNFAYFYWTYKL